MRKAYRCLAPSGFFALFPAPLLACSIPSSTTRAVSQAELAVDEAAASQADTLAPADLQLARSKLGQAEQAARSGQHDRARRVEILVLD
jgi:hypothetical protein